MKLSPTAKRVLEVMVPGIKYPPGEMALMLDMRVNTVGMQLSRMAARRHLDQHRGRHAFEYSLPGTVKTALPPMPPVSPRRYPPSNLGQVIGRLMERE